MRDRLAVVVGDEPGAGLVGERLRRIALEIGHRDEIHRRVLCRKPRAHGADAAGADDGDAQLLTFEDCVLCHGLLK